MHMSSGKYSHLTKAEMEAKLETLDRYLGKAVDDAFDATTKYSLKDSGCEEVTDLNYKYCYPFNVGYLQGTINYLVNNVLN